MQFWARFGTSFLYYSRKWGGIIPSPESGGPIPLLRRLWFSVAWVGKDLFKASRFSVKTIKTEDWLWAFTNQLPHRGSSVLAIFLGKYKLLTNFTHALRHYNNNEILTLSPVFYLENFHKFYLNVENVATSKHVTCICTTICQFRPIFFFTKICHVTEYSLLAKAMVKMVLWSGGGSPDEARLEQTPYPF